jgi:hypothetical protein
MSDMSEESNTEVETTMRLLERLIRKVANEEGFEVEPLPSKNLANFRQARKDSPTRCVDERPVVEEVKGRRTGFSNATYDGIQIPGATPGALDILKKTIGIPEQEAREVIARVSYTDGFRMGAHIDDKHGQIDSPEELLKRKRGCGDQLKKMEGKLPMYKGTNPNDLETRLDWLKSHNAPVIPLSGAHEAQLANINLNPETTYDNLQGKHKGQSMFNCDLGAVAGPLANSIHHVLEETGRNKQGMGKEELREAIAETTARNYLQTLKALGAKPKVNFSK